MNHDDLTPEEKAFLASTQIIQSDVCLECGGKGYFLDANEKATRCKCAKQREMHTLYAEANIPPAYFDMTLDDDWNLNQDAYGTDLGASKPKKQEIKLVMSKYLNNIDKIVEGRSLTLKFPNEKIKVRSLLLVGKVKSGKTMLAAMAAQEAIKKGLSVKYYQWQDDIFRFITDYEYKAEQRKLVDEFKELDLIVIDGLHDYGLEYKNAVFQLDCLASARQHSGKPIIITSDSVDNPLKSGPVWSSFYDELYPISLPSPSKR